MKKTLAVALLALLGLGAWAFASRSHPDGAESGQKFRTEALTRGAIIASVAATGTVMATTTVIVGSQLSGQVVEVLVDHNSQVKAGQVLARLNRDTLLARRDSAVADLKQARAARQLNDAQVEKNRAELQRARAQKLDAQAQLLKSQVLLTDANTTFDRQASLRSRGFASDVTLQSARTQRESQSAARASSEALNAASEAQIASLEADIKVIEAQKASSDAQIAKAEAQVRQIEVDLGNADIKAPVDGVVVQRNVELGQTVAASLQAPTMFLVAEDLRKIEVYVNLDETDVGRVKVGQQVEFTVTAYPARTFEGKVRLVRLGAQTVQNVVIYTTIVEVVNDDLALLPGMTATARIFTERKADVLRISNAALRWQPPGTTRPAGAVPGEAAGPAQSAADDPAGPFAGGPTGPGGANSPANIAQTLKRELALSDSQFTSVEALATTMRDAIQKAGNDQAARRDALRVERQRFARAVEGVLNSEQVTKYRAYRQELAARMQQGGQAGQGGRAPRNAQAGVPARAHVLDDRGNPRAVALRAGASDGTYTELLGSDLKPGESVITGTLSSGRAQRTGSSFRFGL